MLRNDQGSVFRVIHATGCTVQQAEEALERSNNWPDAFKYAKQLMKK